jgi:hypothetical protein
MQKKQFHYLLYDCGRLTSDRDGNTTTKATRQQAILQKFPEAFLRATIQSHSFWAIGRATISDAFRRSARAPANEAFCVFESKLQPTQSVSRQ